MHEAWAAGRRLLDKGGAPGSPGAQVRVPVTHPSLGTARLVRNWYCVVVGCTTHPGWPLPPSRLLTSVLEYLRRARAQTTHVWQPTQ